MILIFGASGFIGTYLTSHLAESGSSVIAADIDDFGADHYARQGVPFYSIDITKSSDFDQLPTEGIDAVVHLACVQPANVSQQAYDPAEYIRVNVLGTLNVLKFCQVHRIPKILYTCSHRNTQGMWDAKTGTAIRESDGRSLKYTGDYAMFSISESAATDCVEHFAQTFGIEAIVFRLPPVYGYGPHTAIFKDGVPLKTGFQVFIEAAQQGLPLEVWGDPSKGRDITYVKDVVGAMELALQKQGVGGFYNISSGRQLSLREQAETIVGVFSPHERPSPISYRPERLNHIESYFYNIEKAKDVLGWVPRYSFADMLIDYRREADSERFLYLVQKRQKQLSVSASTLVASDAKTT